MQADQDRSGVIDFQEFVALFFALTKKSALGVQEAKTILLQRCAPCGPIPDLWPGLPAQQMHAKPPQNFPLSRQQPGPGFDFTVPGCPVRPVNRTPNQPTLCSRSPQGC